MKSIAFLQGVVKNQKIRTKNLEQSLKVSKRKFNQARLTVQELVSEQDVYFQSSLDDISTQLTVIHTLIDYFSVFSDTPCSINRI